MALFRTHFRLKALLVAAGLSIGSLTAIRAAEEKEPPQLSETTRELLDSELRPATEAKDWDKVLVIVEKGISKAGADSYDAALLNQIKAQTLFQKNNTPDALVALERSLAIDDLHQYFPEKTRQETLYLVAQLNYQEGVSSKDPKRQALLFTRSDQALERWIKNNKDFTTDQLYFVAVLYFSKAQSAAEVSGGEGKVDRTLMEKALYWTDRGLRSTTRPRDTFFQLKLAELYQLGRMNDTADYLELVVKMKPENKSYWQQLAATYLQLAANAETKDDKTEKKDDKTEKKDDKTEKKDAKTEKKDDKTEKKDANTEKKDEKAFLSFNLRAILAIERAQTLGIMTTPKDNYNLVGIYFNIGEFAEACALLDKGLKADSIERTQANYELLANSYQQLHREFKAIDALDQATKVFPKSGQLEYEAAQVYFTIDKYKEAFERMKLCIAKGGTDKKHVGWLFYAYIALDLKEYDVALKAAQEAAKYPEAVKEATQMQEAIKATLQDRDNRLKAQQQSL